MPALFAVWVTGLIGAWAWTTPFQGFPDELDHYIRAVSIGRGDVVGLPDEPPPPGAKQSCCDDNAWRLAWVRKGVRTVNLPPEVAPTDLPCRHLVDTGAGCDTERHLPNGRWITAMGTIEPGGYLPAAAATRLAPSRIASFRLARLASAAVSLVLIALAGAVTWRTTRSSAAFGGLLLALTPMTLFIASSPSPNASEIAGAVAFLTGCLAASHPRAAQHRRGVVALVVLGGLALTLSRSLGPVWLASLAVVAFVMGDRRRLVDRVRRHRSDVAVAVGVLGLSALSTMAWEKTVQPRPKFSLSFFAEQVGPAAGDTSRILSEVVGRFGLINVSMPDAVYWGWWALLAAAVVAALVSGTGRAGVLLAVFAAVGALVLVGAAVLRQNGFALQGRHILAVVVAVPIAAGWSLAGRQPQRGLHAAAVVALAWVVLTNTVGWLTNVTGYELGPRGLFAEPNHTGYEGLWGDPNVWSGVVGLSTAAGLVLAVVVARYGAGMPRVRENPRLLLR